MKSDERRISIVGFLILMTLTLAAGVSVYFIMLNASEGILRTSLQLSLKSGVTLLRSSIGDGLADARMMSTRPFIVDSLTELDANSQNAKAVANLNRIAESFVSSQRFVGAAYYDAQGAKVAAAGTFSTISDQRIALNASHGAYLSWDKQFVLHVESDVLNYQGKRIGHIVAESSLASLNKMLSEMEMAGHTSEVALCAPVERDDMDCYLKRDPGARFERLHRSIDGNMLPINHAFDGKAGVAFSKDYRGREVVAAYSPVDDTGLGMVLKINRRELFGPATQQLKQVAVLLTTLVLLGELLLYLMVAPLVRKLIESRQAVLSSNQELQRVNEKNYALLRNASDGIYILGVEGNLIECSDSFCKMLGYERDELIGMHVSRWDATYSPSEIRTNLKLRLAQKGRSQFETRHRRKDGKIIDVEISVYPLELEGHPVLFCSSRNISERKAKDEALRQSRKRLEELLENMSSGVAVYQAIQDGSDFEFTRTNRAFERINKIGREELTGKTLTAVFPGVVEIGLLKAICRVWRSGNPEHFPVSFYRDERISGWRDIYLYKIESGEVVAIFDDVTERMQLQEALRHERDFMDALFQSAGSPILAIDRNGCIVRFNRAAEEISGYSFVEVEGKPFFWKNFILGEQQAEAESIFKATFSGNSKTRYECTWVSKRGKASVLDWANTVILDEEGKASYLLTVGIDVTDRREAESLIRIQSNALNASTNGIAIADASTPDLSLIYVNPAFEKITGYAETELIGRNVRFLQSDDQDQPELDQIRAALKEGRSGTATLRNYRKDGSLYWNNLHISPILDENGKLTHFLGIINDITERRNAEEHLRLVSSVFHYADEGIVITDREPSILEVNPAFTRITGHEREEALGKNPNILRSGRHDRGFYETMWRKLIEEGHWSGEIWNKRRNGEIYPERLTLSAIKNEEGETIRYIGLFSDISDLKRQQQELERMAHHDALTGLPNRNLLGDRLDMAIAQAQRKGEKLAVCFMDLDGFKPVNDNLGHEAGDLLLVEVAQRLLATSRITDTVSRLGGDEFVLIFTSIIDEAECRQMIDRIMNAIWQPFHILGHDVGISTSIGVAIFPEAGSTGDDLLRVADQAMYKAKQAGRGRVQFFEPADLEEG